LNGLEANKKGEGKKLYCDKEIHSAFCFSSIELCVRQRFNKYHLIWSNWCIAPIPERIAFYKPAPEYKYSGLFSFYEHRPW